MRCEGNLMNSTNLNTKEQIIVCGFKKILYIQIDERDGNTSECKSTF